jgi:hypothetical protein
MPVWGQRARLDARHEIRRNESLEGLPKPVGVLLCHDVVGDDAHIVPRLVEPRDESFDECGLA